MSLNKYYYYLLVYKLILLFKNNNCLYIMNYKYEPYNVCI